MSLWIQSYFSKTFPLSFRSLQLLVLCLSWREESLWKEPTALSLPPLNPSLNEKSVSESLTKAWTTVRTVVVFYKLIFEFKLKIFRFWINLLSSNMQMRWAETLGCSSSCCAWLPWWSVWAGLHSTARSETPNPVCARTFPIIWTSTSDGYRGAWMNSNTGCPRAHSRTDEVIFFSVSSSR